MFDAFQKYLCILKYFMKQLKLWPIEGGIKLEASGSHGFDNRRESRSYPLTLGFSCRPTEENRQSYFFFSDVDFSALIAPN